MDNQDNGGIPQSDELLSSSPQIIPEAEVSPIVVIPPVGNAAPEAAPVVAPEAQPQPVATSDKTKVEGESEDEATFHFPAPEPTNNAIQEKNVFAPLDRPWDDANITLTLPPDTQARTRNYLERQPNTDITDTEQGAEWMDNVKAGLGHGSYADCMLSSAKREGAQWKQRIKHGDKSLEAASPRIGDDGPLLKGERGVLRVNALLGRGSILQIPLWHTGIWITIKCPKETSLLDMYQRIMEEKIRFGRVTHGLAFANYTVFMAEALVALAMENVYETSVKDLTSGSELRSLIKAPDLNIIAWGLACAIWPRGFQYTRSLLDENGQKTETIQEKLNVGSLLWVDDTALNDWQRAHMASRVTGSMTKENIKLYQDHFVRGKTKTVALNDVIHMNLRVPTLEQFLNAGQLWINETVAGINAAFTEEANLDQRNKLILSRGKATSLRQYVHWIDSFEFPTIEKRMEDEATISEECSALSADDDIREKYYDLMRDYINESTIAIIATPLANDREKPQALPQFPWLLPIDPISTFFTLLSQKAVQIQMRP